jgi:hypothetical protein
MVSTVDDLMRFHKALADRSLLPAERLDQMLTFLADAPVAYGLGIYRIDTPCGPAIGHNGRVYGYEADVFSSRTHGGRWWSDGTPGAAGHQRAGEARTLAVLSLIGSPGIVGGCPSSADPSAGRAVDPGAVHRDGPHRALHLMPPTAWVSRCDGPSASTRCTRTGWVFDIAVGALAIGSLAGWAALVGARLIAPRLPWLRRAAVVERRHGRGGGVPEAQLVGRAELGPGRPPARRACSAR